MDFWFLISQLGPAMKIIFQIGFIPQRVDFKELPPSQCEEFYSQLPPEEVKDYEGAKILALIPDDEALSNKLREILGEQVYTIKEDQFNAFESAANLIDRYIEESGKSFDSLDEKLKYMAKTLPPVFSKGTPYQGYSRSNEEADKKDL